MQKEMFSSLMDGELIKDHVLIDSLLSDKAVSAYWYRYHIIRDVVQHRLHSQILTMELSGKIALAIADMHCDGQNGLPLLSHVRTRKRFLLYPTMKLLVGRFSQIGLAACVALLAIGGVQYYNYSSTELGTKIPTLNTMPIGITVSPVGGVTPLSHSHNMKEENKMSQKEYEKIYFLLQNHELQRRVNAIQ